MPHVELSRFKQSSDPLHGDDLAVVEMPDLDFDDDDPTRVLDTDPYTPAVSCCTTILPPKVDDGDIYLLTKQHLRYKAGIVPSNPERVDMLAILNAPSDAPPDGDATPRQPSAQKPSSLAPVAMSLAEPGVREDRPTVPAVPRTHPAYAITVGALAVAAVAVLFLPSASAQRPASSLETEAFAAQPAVELQPIEARPVELPVVDVAGVAGRQPQFVVGALPGSPVAAQPPATAPQTASPSRTEPSDELPPVAPPELQVGPFDRGAASAALNVAAAAAGSCREEGSGNFPVNVSVTFATSGVVTNATVDSAPYSGTRTGGCIARAFRSARINPFVGLAVTVHKVFLLP
jgi:hypothetical protein